MRELRRQAVGRKNWMFVGSDGAALVNAAFASLLASCRMHEVEPLAYLRDIFCVLPHWPEHRLLDLSPLCWNATQALPEVVAILDADVYRTVTLTTHLGSRLTHARSAMGAGTSFAERVRLNAHAFAPVMVPRITRSHRCAVS